MFIRYLGAVLRHKWFVFVEACRLGIPWLGLIHDLSKFTPGEIFAYARYFYPGGSPNDRDHGTDFDIAWNIHQKRNRHHWQYWVLMNDNSEPQVRALPMPERYVREMIADWRGAGRAYGSPDTRRWYMENEKKQLMHTATRCRVEELLGLHLNQMDHPSEAE